MVLHTVRMFCPVQSRSNWACQRCSTSSCLSGRVYNQRFMVTFTKHSFSHQLPIHRGDLSSSLLLGCTLNASRAWLLIPSCWVELPWHLWYVVLALVLNSSGECWLLSSVLTCGLKNSHSPLPHPTLQPLHPHTGAPAPSSGARWYDNYAGRLIPPSSAPSRGLERPSRGFPLGEIRRLHLGWRSVRHCAGPLARPPSGSGGTASQCCEPQCHQSRRPHKCEVVWVPDPSDVETLLVPYGLWTGEPGSEISHWALRRQSSPGLGGSGALANTPWWGRG